MKILFICDYYPPYAPGGAEWSSYYLVKALQKGGHRVKVLTPNYEKLPWPFKLKKGQKTLPFWVNNNPVYYFFTFFWIVRAYLKEKPDIVHLQSRFSIPGAVLAKLVLHFPLVINIRSSIIFCPIGLCLHRGSPKREYVAFSHFWSNCEKKYLKEYLKPKNIFSKTYCKLSLLYMYFDNCIKRVFLKGADKVIFISNALKNLYILGGLAANKKTEIIYNIDQLEHKKRDKEKLEELKNKYGIKNKKIVLYVGKKSRGKGTFWLLKSAVKVCRQEEKAVFVFVGKGNLEEFKDKKWTTDINAVEHEKVFDFYAIADIIVVPSLVFEGLGRVVHECAYFKKPVIVSDAGGLEEQIIHGKTGFIVPRKNCEKLSGAILKLLGDEQLRKTMGEKHKENILKKFNREEIIDKTITTYRAVL